MTEPEDAAPFDSVPGIGFDSNPCRRGRSSRRRAASPAPAPRCWSIRRRTTPSGRSTAPGSRALSVGLVSRRVGSAIRDLRAVGIGAGGTGEVARACGRARRAKAARRSRSRAIGLFQPWSGSMDEGWTRWLLERYDFDFVVAPPRGLPDAADRAYRCRHPGRRREDPDGRGVRWRARGRRDAAARWARRRRAAPPGAAAAAQAGARGRGARRRGPRRPARVRVRADGGRPPGVRRVHQGRRHAGVPQRRHALGHPAVQAAGARTPSKG